MQTYYNTNKVLDVKTAKIYTNLGYRYLDAINASYLYRTMLNESIDKLKNLKPLIKDESKVNSLVKEAEGAIANNLSCLSNPRTSIIQDFKSVEELESCYTNFCEEMDMSRSGLYHAREKIEYFIKQFESELNAINEEFGNYNECKLQFLALKQQMTELSEENSILKKTISILSK